MRTRSRAVVRARRGVRRTPTTLAGHGKPHRRTNLGASIGTALAGAVLISTLTTSFLAGVQENPAVSADLASTATVQLAGGIPFVSNADLEALLETAQVPAETADAIVEENSTARLDGLRASLAVIAMIALVALYFTRRIPTKQSKAAPA